MCNDLKNSESLMCKIILVWIRNRGGGKKKTKFLIPLSIMIRNSFVNSSETIESLMFVTRPMGLPFQRTGAT